LSFGRALITGGAGQLASDLAASLGGVADVHRLDRGELDITDDGAVARTMARLGPDLVLNCAAFHDVDRCEREEEAAAAANVRAVKRLAEGCAERGALLVHFSTNYVFDGEASRPYVEGDLPNPRSVYAITKLAGEHAALAYAPEALVVRTAGLYGLAGSAVKGGNFVQRMVARAQSGERIRMVADQRLTPTLTADLAAAVVAAIEAGARRVLHLTNSGACSWHEFTLAILAEAGLGAEVESVATKGRPGTADRPLNGVLESERLGDLGLAPLRDWREALSDYLQQSGVRQAAPDRAQLP
jgi:dTDP-4-dehydrorhamnose reductase